MIKTKVRKHYSKVWKKNLFMGYVVITCNGKFLWSKCSGIMRITEEDAKQDAKILADELQGQ